VVFPPFPVGKIDGLRLFPKPPLLLDQTAGGEAGSAWVTDGGQSCHCEKVGVEKRPSFLNLRASRLGCGLSAEARLLATKDAVHRLTDDMSTNANPSVILTLNAGSSSLRFAVFIGGDRKLAGKFERLGRPDAQLLVDGDAQPKPLASATHAGCLPRLFKLFEEYRIESPVAVAHRVVHGGPDHFAPARVTPTLLAELRAIESFAPNHLPAVIALMEASLRCWPAAVQVAAFDTAFHRDLPATARLLPLPRRFAAQGVRRYGFHGLAFTSVLEKLRERSGGILPARIILAHLGHGASLAAVREGRCVDTTMGFTPAGGLVMSTRAGDLDPGLLAFVAAREKLTPDALERLVTKESGLLGISETSSDTRELLARESSDPRAAEALAVFVHQARKFIGAFVAVLGGIDALVFSGGVGENSAVLRARICADFGYLGMKFDLERNAANAAVISSPGSAVVVHLVPADEERTLAGVAQAFCAEER
jgi:acetate kinase